MFDTDGRIVFCNATQLQQRNALSTIRKYLVATLRVRSEESLTSVAAAVSQAAPSSGTADFRTHMELRPYDLKRHALSIFCGATDFDALASDDDATFREIHRSLNLWLLFPGTILRSRRAPTLQSAAEISDVPLAPPEMRPRSSLEQPAAPLGTFIADRINKSRCPRRLRDKDAWASASAIVKLPLVGLVD